MIKRKAEDLCLTDFHSHIIPGIDDGSKSIEESEKLLAMLDAQGVRTTVLTPHFYASENNVERFLEKRDEALERLLQSRIPEEMSLYVGAEVLYYEGISRTEDLDQLRINGTNLLLLEMPFHPWSSRVVHEVLELNQSRHMQIVLAHIDRYLEMQEPSVWDRFLDEEILMQVNADFFLPFKTRRKAARMLKEGMIHFIGSDCHNLTSRAPRMDEAAKAIESRCGIEYLQQLEGFSQECLGNPEVVD